MLGFVRIVPPFTMFANVFYNDFYEFYKLSFKIQLKYNINFYPMQNGNEYWKIYNEKISITIT